MITVESVIDHIPDGTISLGSCRSSQSILIDNLSVMFCVQTLRPQVITANRKESTMFQRKLAVVWIVPLALWCAVASAQELPQNCLVKAPEPPVFAVPSGDVYGTYVPYTEPPSVAQTKDAASCSTPTAQPAPISSSKQASPSQTIPDKVQDKVQSKVADPAPLSCNTELWVADKVYGPYVPYKGPPLACVIPTETAHNASPLEPSIELPADLIKPTTPQPTTNDSTIDPGSAREYVRSVPIPSPVTGPLVDMKPFRTYAIGFKADTLGLGVEIATPLAGSFNLRSSFNFFAFNDPFSIDGINYDAKLRLQSSETVLDWFVGKGLHISPGLLYVKNSMSAPAFVGPGQSFLLGTQTFINSVDDPVSGTSSVVFPHSFAPMLLIGYGNILPRSNHRLSFPIEIGAAYTGVPQIAVNLNGTACTTNGCFRFSGNSSSQSYVKQEVDVLNEGLKRYPYFPIVSMGVAYHF